MKYIKPTAVRAYCNAHGKLCCKNFLVWLDAKVERVLDRHITALGQHKTLNAYDASAVDMFHPPTRRK